MVHGSEGRRRGGGVHRGGKEGIQERKLGINKEIYRVATVYNGRGIGIIKMNFDGNVERKDLVLVK